MKTTIKNMVLVLAFIAMSTGNLFAQVVTLIDPTGDGGFENGSTFAANGYTVAAGVATNQWFVGNAATPFAGNNCAYISSNGFGTTYDYNVTSVSTVYFYRDIAFPVGKGRITMVINWKSVGENFFDRPFVCYTDPANTPVVNDFLSSTPPQYATAVTGNYNSWGISANQGVGYSSMTVLLPSNFAGTTKRIMFGWQNNNSGGSGQPGAFDNISLTAEPPITCTPTVYGGLWSDPASWTGGLYPGTGDDVSIPDGTSITLDVSQVIRNITVGTGTSGILNFSTSFNALTLTGDITVNNGGRFNAFTHSASPTSNGIVLNVAGNINLNSGGKMIISHSGAVLNMNGTAPQSINGPGTFLENQVRVLVIANPTSVTLNVPTVLTEALRHYAGTLNTNGNLTIDNTPQSYGNAYNQQVYTVVVTGMGSGYLSQPTVTISAPTGTGVQATATANWDPVSQKVRSITITNPGDGYRANPTVTFSGATFTTAAVSTPVVLQSIQGGANFLMIKNGGTVINGGITSINNNQGVGGISITNTTANNIGYTSAPTVNFAVPVRTFLTSNTGTGYTGATVAFAYPSGTIVTAPTATALVANGKVTSIAISAGGAFTGGNGTVNVTINPTVGGTGATVQDLNIPVATANISNGMVSSFTITNAGADYVTAPAITLTGGGFTAAAAAPSCRIGLYNLQYSIQSAPTGVAAPVGYTIANVAAVESIEMPANRKLFSLTINNPRHLTLNDNVELTANASALSTTNGIINFSGANKTITCSNPAYNGGFSSSSSTLPSFVNGIETLTSPGGSATKNFAVGRSISIATGTGTGAAGTGSDITSISAQTDIVPTGTFTAGTYTFTGFRTYNVIRNGTQYGTGPTAAVQWNVEDNLASDNQSLHVAQATATSGPWTVRTIAGTAGILPVTGTKTTATGAPGPIVYNANDFFTFATSFTPPPALNYLITRTTGNTYNSIASTGSPIPSWAGINPSTETQRSNPVLLTGTTFQYQGVAVTGFVLGIDGYFTFNTAHTANLNTVQLAASPFAPIISALAPFWANISCTGTYGSAAVRDASIKYKIDGTLGTGTAIITIEWIHMTGSQNPVQNTGSDLNFQIKLFESDNHIEFNYGLMEGFTGSSQAHWSYTTGMNGSLVQAFPTPGQVLALQEHDENTTNFTNEKAHVGNQGTNVLHTLPACYSSYIFTPGAQVPYVPGSIIPANDEPAGAVVLTELPSPPTDYCGAKYTSYGATPTVVPAVCTGNADDDVWFKFTATDPETAVKVVSSGGYDAAIQVFDASLNLLSPTVCKDTSNDGRIEIANISGLTLSNDYYVRVYHKLGGTQATATATVDNGGISSVTVTNPGSGYAILGSFGLPRVRVSGGGGNNGVLQAITAGTNAAPGGITSINVTSIGTGYTSAPTITIDPPSAGLTGDFAIAVYSNSPPPSNDGICGPAISLTVGSATCNAVAGTTLGATASGGIPVCTGVADDDVFYSFVAPAGGNPITIQVQGSGSFDAVMQVLSSNNNLCSGTLTSVSCSDFTLGGGLETVTTTSLVAGNTYFVRVYHATAGAGGGAFTICVFESGPPCPNLITLPDGSLAYIGGTTLKWNASVTATSYDVYLSTVQADVVNGAPAALVSNQGLLTYTTGALTNGTVYYWRVDARNAVGPSVGCTVRSFTATTNLIIGSDATVCSGNFYDSGGPSAGYQNNENSTTTICPSTVGTSSSVTFTSFSLSTLLGSGDALFVYNGPTIASPQFAGSPFTGNIGPTGNTYTSTDNSGCITFRFISDGDNSTGIGWSTTVNCAIACTPSPTSPTNGGNLCELPNNTLSWPSNPSATGYDVYLDNNINPTTLVSTNQGGNTYNAGALATGIYYWKVVSRNGAIVCANPTIWSFTVVALPIPDAFSNSPVCEGAPVTLFGDNLASGQSTGNVFSWTGPNTYTSSLQNPTIGSTSLSNAGTYFLTVTNQYGCTSTAPASTNITINPNPILNAASVTNASCLGSTDGCIDIDATNGTPLYLYDLDGNATLDGVYCGLPAGTYTVTVIDDNGCEGSINTTVIEQDIVDPVITCPSNVTLNNTPGLCEGVATWTGPVGTDNCAGATTAQTGGLASGSTFPVGISPITYTVTDAFLNTATCSFNVTVIDNQNPTITCPADLTINASSGFCYATGVALGSPSNGDNCGVLGITNNAPAQFPVGATIVDWEVEDLAGNKAGCQQLVIVVDNQNPVISGMPSNITFTADPTNCNPSITWTAPTAADNCSVASFTSTSNSGDNFPEGTTTVTYTAIDINGNQTQASFTVTVNIQPLVLTITPTVHNCGYNISCNGGNNGQAIAAVTGGCLPYDVLWSNGATTLGNGSLVAGTYTCTITDGNGLVTVQSVILTQPPVALSTTLGPDQSYEFSCTCANLVAATAGGSTCQPYAYSWSTGATTSALTVCPGQTTTYTVTVTDINGCITTDVIQISKPAVVAQLDRYVLMGTGTGNVSVGSNCSFTNGSVGKRLAAGTLSLGNNTFCNISVAGNNVVVGNNCIISTLYRNTATIGSGAVISSTVTPVTMPLTAKVPCFPIYSGGSDVTVANGATVTISPGTYNNIVLGNNSILKLNAGVYNVNSVSTGNGSFILPNGTATAKDIMVFVKTTVTVGNNNTLHGSYYAQGAMDLANGNNTTGSFYGAYFGNPVSVGNNLSFFLDTYCYSNLALCTVKIEGDETSLETEASLFKLYPNPNNGMFTIQYAGQTGNEINMSVLNTLGQVVYQRDVHEFTGEITQEIDLNTLTPGVYFIQVRNGNEFSRKQFIITK